MTLCSFFYNYCFDKTSERLIEVLRNIDIPRQEAE